MLSDKENPPARPNETEDSSRELPSSVVRGRQHTEKIQSERESGRGKYTMTVRTVAQQAVDEPRSALRDKPSSENQQLQERLMAAQAKGNVAEKALKEMSEKCKMIAKTGAEKLEAHRVKREAEGRAMREALDRRIQHEVALEFETHELQRRLASTEKERNNQVQKIAEMVSRREQEYDIQSEREHSLKSKAQELERRLAAAEESVTREGSRRVDRASQCNEELPAMRALKESLELERTKTAQLQEGMGLFAAEAERKALVRRDTRKALDRQRRELPSLRDRSAEVAKSLCTDRERLKTAQDRLRRVERALSAQTSHLMAVASQLASIHVQATVLKNELRTPGAGRGHGGEVGTIDLARALANDTNSIHQFLCSKLLNVPSRPDNGGFGEGWRKEGGSETEGTGQRVMSSSGKHRGHRDNGNAGSIPSRDTHNVRRKDEVRQSEPPWWEAENRSQPDSGSIARIAPSSFVAVERAHDVQRQDNRRTTDGARRVDEIRGPATTTRSRQVVVARAECAADRGSRELQGGQGVERPVLSKSTRVAAVGVLSAIARERAPRFRDRGVERRLEDVAGMGENAQGSGPRAAREREARGETDGPEGARRPGPGVELEGIERGIERGLMRKVEMGKRTRRSGAAAARERGGGRGTNMGEVTAAPRDKTSQHQRQQRRQRERTSTTARDSVAARDIHPNKDHTRPSTVAAAAGAKRPIPSSRPSVSSSRCPATATRQSSQKRYQAQEPRTRRSTPGYLRSTTSSRRRFEAE